MRGSPSRETVERSPIWAREKEGLVSGSAGWTSSRRSPIQGSQGGTSPFFSPDGKRLGFITNGTSVRIASLDGSPLVTLTDKANSTAGDWGDDGYVYFEVDSGLGRMKPNGRRDRAGLQHVTRKTGNEVGAEWPCVLPGGKGIIFRLRRAGQGPADFNIVAMKLPMARNTC